MSVLVNPNKPLSLEDFASIYTANGQTPQQNASSLWFNAPAEGRSYMEDQWSKLGTGTSPEQFFSNPAHVAAVTASSPSVHAVPNAMGQIPVSPGNTGQSQWLMYASDAARQTVANLGMDQRFSYTTPDRMLASVTEHLAGTSHDPEHLLRDPQLQSLMQVDPTKAKFVYEKLTGGSYDKDKAEVDSIDRTQKVAALNEQRKFQRAPMEFGIKTVQDLISRGAHFDPNSGQLSTWQNVQPDASAIDQRPVRQRIPATPEEKYIWEHYYPFAMGMPSPKEATPDPSLQAARDATLNDSTDLQAKAKAALQQAEGLRGQPLTAEQTRAVIDKVRAENRPLIAAPGEDSRYQDFANSFMGGIIGRQGWDPSMTNDQTNTLPQNAWGKIGNKLFGLQDRAINFMMSPLDHILPEVPDRFKTPQQRAEDEAAKQAAQGVAIPGLPR